ncbi:hypothetical protein LCGC14_1054360 [marine sediment metagenome]|uniref:Uncharacterized protein n=1 Tax=marine sediment metagenome TaxID=412755 RepID=A0A0F9QTY8_9ZZZZ
MHWLLLDRYLEHALDLPRSRWPSGLRCFPAVFLRLYHRSTARHSATSRQKRFRHGLSQRTRAAAPARLRNCAKRRWQVLRHGATSRWPRNCRVVWPKIARAAPALPSALELKSKLDRPSRRHAARPHLAWNQHYRKSGTRTHRAMMPPAWANPDWVR